MSQAEERNPSESGPGHTAWRWAALVILLLWSGLQLGRVFQPMRAGHEAFISRQIGRTARNHLVLGLGVTKGANVTAVRHDGGPIVHSSYSPLASWLVAAPLALGVPFDVAIRLTAWCAGVTALAGLWVFVRNLWGDQVACVSLACAATTPILLLKYMPTCIFEILALGPLMWSLALFTGPRRDRRAWTAIAATSIAAVMLSWICWLVVLPALAREAWLGRRAASWATAWWVAAAVVVVPAGLHFALLWAASGDVAGFFRHVGYRLGSTADVTRESIGFRRSAGELELRWRIYLGSIPFACTILYLAQSAVGVCRQGGGFFWPAVLCLYALPLTLIARNIAWHHDFFLILFVPLGALSAGSVIWQCVQTLGTPRRQVAGALLVWLAYLTLNVYPQRKMAEITSDDVRCREIVRAIGREVRPDDLVLVNREFCFAAQGERFAWELREQVPLPIYCGMMCQTAWLAYDSQEAAELAGLARPGQRVVVLQLGEDKWPLPAGFRALDVKIESFVLAERRPDRQTPNGGAQP